MRGVGIKQRFRFVTALVALPLFVGSINYCLINEVSGLPPCGVDSADAGCPGHAHGASEPMHHHGAQRQAPASHQPTGAPHPCCTSLVSVVAPKVMGSAGQSTITPVVLIQATEAPLHAASWYGRNVVPTERVLPLFKRSPSAPRAPPLS